MHERKKMEEDGSDQSLYQQLCMTNGEQELNMFCMQMRNVSHVNSIMIRILHPSWKRIRGVEVIFL